MAANKFAAMLQRSAHSITAVLVSAVLEWILILLLLLSSTLSYFTERFAAYFGLKPPCSWCSRINRVLQPDRKNAHFCRDLFCEEHAREVSELGYCSNHRRLAESGRLCSDCSPSRLPENAAEKTTGISASIGFFTWVSESAAENNSCRCSCCDESLSKKLDLPCLQFKPSWDILHQIWKTRVVNDDRYEEFELSADQKNGNRAKNGDNLAFPDSDTESFSFGPIVEQDCSISVSNFPRYQKPSFLGRDKADADDNFPEHEQQQNCFRILNVGAESSDNIVSVLEEGGDENLTIEQLKSALNASYAELEEERNAAAIAASQTMAMISKLQEEKAAMQMEALQYQRMMEEQSEYDQEALQILNDLMMKREKEKQELEKELETSQKKVSYYESREKTRRRSKQSPASPPSSPTYEGKHDNISISNVDLIARESDTDSLEHISVLDKSVIEFEEERTSILQELKELEDRLLALADENGTLEHFPEDYESYVHSFLEQNGNSIGSSERESLSSTAKNLLPLLDEEAESIEEELEEHSPSVMINSRLAIMEEFGHVYEKLQALEADKEFLKHSISSLKKGDKGLDLLQEILQHLRDLKSVESAN
ncbi:PREDICTED: myosin-binding protein 2 [Ipomoea nil]|uniref:myosin-binding protein 2 n=1 Tax=Ipomoea nil TaxID=35883 RepID=UPI0009011FFC|nr:PREDICTED: myosin-binding protein 2 [Ipomoea nil]